jgi:Uma2 family endonuclease
MTQAKTATLEDLAKVQGKAEIVNGRIIEMSPTGFLPGYAATEIVASLREYARRTKSGYAIGDNVDFIIDLPKRTSFSPDAAFHKGPHTGMKFLEGAPVFAVEVRSESDYGPKAKKDIAAKRADYFAAGTLIVWDVDMLSTEVVRAYHASQPDQPIAYHRGDVLNAEPALPGWTMPVDELFPYHTTEQG